MITNSMTSICAAVVFVRSVCIVYNTVYYIMLSVIPLLCNLYPVLLLGNTKAIGEDALQTTLIESLYGI